MLQKNQYFFVCAKKILSYISSKLQKLLKISTLKGNDLIDSCNISVVSLPHHLCHILYTRIHSDRNGDLHNRLYSVISNISIFIPWTLIINSFIKAVTKFVKIAFVSTKLKKGNVKGGSKYVTDNCRKKSTVPLSEK